VNMEIVWPKGIWAGCSSIPKMFKEVLDLMLVAYRVAEDERVLTPAMVCLDGFFLSHSMQKVDVPEEELVDDFVGPYIRKMDI